MVASFPRFSRKVSKLPEQELEQGGEEEMSKQELRALDDKRNAYIKARSAHIKAFDAFNKAWDDYVRARNTCVGGKNANR